MGEREQPQKGKKGKPALTRGERNIQWVQAHCMVPEGRLVGKPVVLTPEQRKWIITIYDSPTRRFILTMGRKNGKTALSAMLLLLHLVGPEARENSQLYSAAQSREQAGVLFNLAAKMVRFSPDLVEYVSIRESAKSLVCPELGTVYRALSAEASTAMGLSPVFVVHDELGQTKGPRSALYSALETASAAQEEPLSIIISTQAPKDGDLLSVLIDDAVKGGDPRTKVALYTADESLDPFSEEAIRQANPHYDVLMNKQEVLDQAEAARRMPSAEAEYRNLILNQRVNMTNPFVTRSVWEACRGSADFSEVEEVFVGVDLSAKNDLTALVAVGRDPLGVWHVQPYFFAPQVGIVERSLRDREQYDVWAEQGYITLTPGVTIDLDYAAMQLAELCDAYPVREIPYDRWGIAVMQAALSRLGVELPLVEFGQGFKDMSPALDTLESLLLQGRIRHGGNPVLDMCAENAVATRDPAGNRKLDKSKATGRIDGMQALAMAIGQAAKYADDSVDITDFLMDPVTG